MVDIEDLLVQIEEELANGKKSLFGAGVTVNAEVIYSLVDKIRSSIPDMIREARQILSNAERIQIEETKRAQNIIQVAQQRADAMLAEHNIIMQAQREAEAIKRQAIEFDTRMREGVYKDIGAMLSDTESILEENLALIRKAIASKDKHSSDN